MRKTGTRLLAVLLAVVMVLPSVLIPGMAAEATGFTDVPEGSWYADAVNYVSEKGYMAGVGDNRFAPNDEVTRAMFVTILARITMAETDGTVSAFTDVPANKWYTGAVSWAAENGIVNGVGDGMFAPGKSITRQDLCTILYRFVNAMDYELTVGEEKTFTDSASVSSYAAEAVRYASSVGLIAGYDDGTFRPKATATRAQMAVIIMRLARLLDGQIVKPEPMPAQSFDQTSEQMQVSVNAPEGALPENTKMTVSRVTDEAALAELASKVGAEVLGAADISFAKDGAELEPARKVSVRIALDAIQSAKNPAVVHVKDDGSFEYVSSSVVTTRGKADAVEFEADSFSVYAVVGGEGGSSTLTITFYARENGSTGAWKPINKQIIRQDQLLDDSNLNPIFDPGVPNISTTESFEGWYLGTASDGDYSESDTGVSVAEINKNWHGETLTGNIEQHYYAMVYPVLYVVYHDQNGAVLMTESYHKNGSNQASVTINWPYVPFTGGYTFTGWTPNIVTKGENPTYSANPTVYRNGQSSTISATLNLYPYVQVGYWLSFDNNLEQNNTKNGFDDPTTASYTAPVFAASGVNPTRPTDPERPGYTFGGWYDNSNLSGSPFNFNTPLTKDTTLYAKWNPSSTTYTIVYWTQVRTDDKNAADANKQYEYYKSSSARSATSCSPVRINKSGSGTTADNRLGGNDASNIGEMGFGFKYNSNNTASKNGLSSDTGTVKVRGDGGTIINVYYDRKTITYTFKTSSSGSGTPYSGLYQSELSPVQDAGNGYLWFCTDINAYIGQKVANFTYPGTYRDSYTIQKQQDTSTSYKTVHEMVQGLNGTELSGTWNEGFTLKITDAQPVAQIPIDLFPGFTGYRYNMSSNNPTGSGSGEFPQGTGSQLQIAYSYYYSNYNRIPYITGQDAYVYFSRNQYVFTYRSNNEDLNPQTMYYGATLTGLKDYVPTNGPDDCFFDGWYLDSGLVQPFDFNSYMPYANKIIFAKWTPKKYRVILNYDPESLGVTAGSGAQASFLVNAGEQIDRNALGNFTCDGKRLMGWYTDPEFKHPFNPESLIYDTVSDVNTYYGEKMPGETDADYNTRMAGETRRGTDAASGAPWSDNWNTDDPDNAGVARTVRGQLQLYALWRADPDGAVGMHVTYLGDNLPDTGYFDVTEPTVHPHTWKDPDLYSDHSWAYAQPASVPDRPDDRQFLYWEILDDEGQPTGRKVYPGQTFEILLDDAYQGTEPPTNCEHTEREFVAAVAATCDTAGNSAHYRCTNCGRRFATNDPSDTTVINPTIPALGHNWNFAQATYSWDDTVTPYTCTATAHCTRNGEHTLTETVNGVPHEDTPATGSSTGLGHYTATFTNTGFAEQTINYIIPELDEVTVSFVVPTGVASVPDVSAVPGSSITLPSAGAPSGSTFLGWTNAPVSNASSAPSYSASGTGFTVPDEGATLYALYTRSETKFDLVTSAPSSWTGNYVITAGSDSSMYVLKGMSGNTSYQSSNSGGHATLSASGITLDGSSLKNVTDVYVFVAEVATGSYYTLKNKSTGTWLDCYFSTLESYSYNDSPTTINWTLGYDTSSSYTTAVPRSSNSSKLSWQGSYFYVNSSQNSTRKIQFWKESSGTYYYTGSASGTSAVIGETESIGDAGLTANVNQSVDTAVLELVSYNPSNPVRDGEPATEYNIFLRAVYGPYNPDATTHIYWYANNGTDYHNGAGERYISKYKVTEGGTTTTTTKLPINAQVDIPLPTGNPASQTVFVGDNNGTLTWEDHVFLGWARVDNGGTADAAEAKALTADDLYLKWDGSKYLVKNDRGEFVAFNSQKVYADETTPYHDMYAVWAGFYYVYHSSDGTLEAVELTGTKQVDETTGKTTLVPDTKNLVSMVRDGYLYGGYYKSYRGAQTIAGGETTMKSRINSEVLQSTGFWDYTNSKVADGMTNYIDLTAAGAEDYDATTDKIMLDGSLVRLWNKTDAYGKTETGDAWAAVKGSAMTPVVGKIYYLREVPNAYLPNVALAICDKKDESGNVTDEITKVYVLSASDELLYTTTQFSLAEDKVKATVSKQFIVDYREPNQDGGYTPTTVTYTADKLRAGLNGKIGWVLSYEIPVANLKTDTGLVVKPSWTTYDGVTVYGDQFTYKITPDGKTLERNK